MDTKKSGTVSFRLDSELVKKLRKEAARQDVSLNVLANKVFKRYVDWGMFESQVGMVPVARPILDALFKKFSDKEIIELAQKVGRDIVRDIAKFMKGSMDLESFMSWFETRMKMSNFDMNHSVQGNTHTYIIKHELGKNWSLYHKTVLELIFHDIFQKPIKIEINERMFEITFST
ncbi:hypothetical protein [Candidatus Nitrosotenuis sp. DW1]|uniref:hypothetical protein n=1 Tax=Candidatus Nitrosotenuis sp. DW1 TaxID=2259672 RepID=UPI0015CA04CA|nr:hypothetical protein [Candidatus Nitrosotenuis sp. DW1]QLH08964.1 hypothetical protein DSQ19_05260 [Candidatus Nitrosotenuis sp. DW1]